MALQEDLTKLQRNDEQFTSLQLFRPEVEATKGDIDELILALESNTCVSRVRVHVQANSFFDAGEDSSDYQRQRLFETLGSLRSLVQLKIESYSGLLYFPIRALSDALRHAQQLQELELWDLKLAATTTHNDFQMLQVALQHHRNLQKFTLYNCQLEESTRCASRTLDPLLLALSTIPTLKKVYMTAAAASSSATSHLDFNCSSLQQLCRSTSLKELGLWKFDFSMCASYSSHGTSAPQASTASITETLPPGAFINKNQAEASDMDPLSRMAPEIASRNCIRILDMGKIQLSESADNALASMLRVNTSLEELNLQVEETTSSKPSTFKSRPLVLAQALKRNTTLKKLKLWGNLRRTSQESLIDMIENNFCLETFRLLDADPDITMAIDFYIQLNRVGRRRLLQCWDLRDDENNHVIAATQCEWVDALARVRCNVSQLFYFISMNPGLCQRWAEPRHSL